MPLVFIPPLARDVTGGVGQVDVPGATVGDVIELLERRFPGLRDRLCRGDSLVPGIQVSVDDVLTKAGLHAKLKPASEVHFLPAIGGG